MASEVMFHLRCLSSLHHVRDVCVCVVRSSAVPHYPSGGLGRSLLVINWAVPSVHTESSRNVPYIVTIVRLAWRDSAAPTAPDDENV